MNSFTRLARENGVVKVTTNNGAVYTGALLPMYALIQEGEVYGVEILLEQHELHEGDDFGAICIPVSYISSVEVIDTGERKRQRGRKR